MIDHDQIIEASDFLNKAIETLKQLIFEYPDHEMNYVEMVATLKTLTDVKIQQNKNPEELYKQAQFYLEKVKIINPKYPDSWFEQANIQIALGNYYAQVNQLTKASDFYNKSIKNANKSITLGIKVENLAIISVALAKLATINIQNNNDIEGINLYKKSLLKFDELFTFVNDDFAYYDRYLAIIFDYILFLENIDKEYEYVIEKAKTTINTLCQSEFIQEHQYKVINKYRQKYLEMKFTYENDLVPCPANNVNTL